MRLPAALACLLLACPALPGAASDSYKCKDARGGIVYSNETCEKQGLKDAGPVRERLTTMPSVSPTGKPPAKDAKDDKARPPAKDAGAGEPKKNDKPPR